MKISTKGRYGLRTLIDLAAHEEEAPVSLAVIAERQGISINYLEQVFAILKRAQLVKSIKGAQGGYRIACIPSEILLKDILVLLEGNLSVVEYEVGEATKNKLEACIRQFVWDKIDEAIDEIIENLTLQDMIDEYKILKNGCHSTLFEIGI